MIFPEFAPLSTTHRFMGYGMHPSRCNVHVFPGKQTVVLLEDINEGTSVTNACEQIATEVVQKWASLLRYREDPATVLWLERDSEGMFAKVEFTWEAMGLRGARRARHPVWSPITEAGARDLIRTATTEGSAA